MAGRDYAGVPGTKTPQAAEPASIIGRDGPLHRGDLSPARRFARAAIDGFSFCNMIETGTILGPTVN